MFDVGSVTCRYRISEELKIIKQLYQATYNK